MKILGVLFGGMFVTMMSALWFEYWTSRRHGLGWHVPADTLTNLNLAGGRMALGVVGTVAVLGGYGWVAARAPVDLDAVLGWGSLPLGLLLTEFLQYASHRAAHRWRWFGWAHLTHHSSSHLNLSTSMRISWVYRYYVWMAYLPLALLGYGVVEFVAFQGILNAYNQFLHTRFDPPYGPLRYVLLTPAAHRLHHVREPAWFGNYGAMFCIFDRLFGTYRELPEPSMESSLHYGMQHNQDTADLWALNVGPLIDRPAQDGLTEVQPAAWVAVVLLTVYVMAGVTQQAQLSLVAQGGFAIGGVLLSFAFARGLQGPLRKSA